MLVFELGDLSAINADEVVVTGTIEEVRIVGRIPVTEVNLVQEVGLDEESQSAVESSSRSRRLAFPRTLEELISSEVLIGRKDEIDNGISLRCLSKTLRFNKGIQFFADSGRHARV